MINEVFQTNKKEACKYCSSPKAVAKFGTYKGVQLQERLIQ